MELTGKKKSGLNISLFLAGWFLCVMTHSTVIALTVTVMILAGHFFWLGSWRKEREIVVITILMGAMVDSFLGNLAIIQFGAVDDLSRTLPAWLACIWALLGITIRHSMASLNQRRGLTFVVGLLFALVHYLALIALTEIKLAEPLWQTLLLLSVIWGIAFNIIQAFSSVWLERYKRHSDSI